MTAVTFLLIDSRLQSNRRMRTEVTIKPVNLNGPHPASLEPIFTDLAGSYEEAESAVVDLEGGIWFIEFASYLGSKVSTSFKVSPAHFRYEFDAAKLDGYYSTPKSGAYKRLEQQRRFGAPVLARQESTWKLIPSSAKMDDKKTRGLNSLFPRIFLSEYVYENRTECSRTRRKNFSNLKSFDERFEYWMQDWERVAEATELQTDISPNQNSELITSRTCVRVDDRDRDWPCRFVLVIEFSDERYLFVLPGKLDAGECSSTVDVEIDFYGSSSRGAGARIVQARVLTSEPRINGVLQQLGLGSLYSARNIWVEGAKRLLFEKYRNPVTAAAGALILVQPDVLGNKDFVAEKNQLKDWFVNLFRDFRWLPEGAICLAWLYGAGVDPFSDRPIDDPAHMKRYVSHLLEEAVDRGLPFYAEGLRLLSQGVEWAEDELNPETRNSVRWLAMSSVRAGPFLLFRDRIKEG